MESPEIKETLYRMNLTLMNIKNELEKMNELREKTLALHEKAVKLQEKVS